MMKSIFLGAVTVSLLAGVAQGQIFTTGSATPNTLIPDGNPVGVTSVINLSGVSGTISSVTVTLDITGGFNGDLYVLLSGPGGSSVLLNEVGVDSGNPLGYGDSGFNVTFSDGAANIHYYQLDTPTMDGNGALTGTWAPDGRTVTPGTSPASAYDGASTAADLSSFNNTSANGAWTMFVSDVSGGGGSQAANFVSWGLTVVTVPEPQTWVLLAGGVGVLLALNRKRKL